VRWLLDYRRRRLQAYRLGAQGYEPTGTYGPGEVFRPELFPGLAIPLDDLWT
jgi:Uma2 family endonuclease